MDRKQLSFRIEHMVNLYIDDMLQLGQDAQIAIDPKDYYVNLQTAEDRDSDIDDSDATVEAAAASEGLADQDGMDYQSSRNWLLYPARNLVRRDGKKYIPDSDRIAEIVDECLSSPDNSRTPYTY